MKKVTEYAKSVLLFSLLLLFSSCSRCTSGNGQFVVYDVEENRTYTRYKLVATANDDQVCIEAAVGQYHVGDTLKLVPLNPKQNGN